VSLPADLAARHAWRGALVACVLNTLGMPLDLLLAHDVPRMPWYPGTFSAAVGAGLVGLLLIRRERATVRLGSAALLVNIAVILVALWITSGYWASSGRPWTPFQANKLGLLAIPLVAPQLWVGLLCIAGFAAMAIGKFYVLAPEIQRALPVGEPWVILPYALFGGVLLAYRLRGLKMEREMLRMDAERVAAERMARAFLRLRDYANTPVQTITFSAQLIRAQAPQLGVILERMERAIERLKMLSRALDRYESAHQWRPGDESPDPSTLTDALPGNEPPRL
jgi:hypothetical protein